MTATTPTWGLRYPNDYNQPADSPLAFSQLATDVDNALTRATKPEFTGLGRTTDVLLFADVIYAIPWETTAAQPPGTVPALSMQTNGIGSIFNAGLYLFEADIDVRTTAVGRKALFELLIERWGTEAGTFSIKWDVEAVAAGNPSRIFWRTVVYFGAGDAYQVRVRPVGASATDWTLSYARNQLTRIR